MYKHGEYRTNVHQGAVQTHPHAMRDRHSVPRETSLKALNNHWKWHSDIPEQLYTIHKPFVFNMHACSQVLGGSRNSSKGSVCVWGGGGGVRSVEIDKQKNLWEEVGSGNSSKGLV